MGIERGKEWDCEGVGWLGRRQCSFTPRKRKVPQGVVWSGK